MLDRTILCPHPNLFISSPFFPFILLLQAWNLESIFDFLPLYLAHYSPKLSSSCYLLNTSSSLLNISEIFPNVFFLNHCMNSDHIISYLDYFKRLSHALPPISPPWYTTAIFLNPNFIIHSFPKMPKGFYIAFKRNSWENEFLGVQAQPSVVYYALC